MKFGLKENIIQKIQDVFSAFPQVEEVILYGSRAKGNFKNVSDIDLTLKGENLNLSVVNKISLMIDDLLLPYTFDLSVYNHIDNKDLLEHIKRSGITFYKKEEWKEYRFSDFALVNPPVKLKKGEVYSFVEMKDLSDGQKFCEPSQERTLAGGARFENGDTLFARITPCLENGKICQVRNLKDGVGFGSTEFHVFRGKENISDSDFIFYLSRTDEVRSFAEMNFDGTSGRQRVPKNCFDNLFLKLPALPEQKAIAEVLNSLDDKIDLLNRQNKTLEELSETIFRQWFVEEAEESWEIGRLGDAIELVYGKALKEETRTGNGFPVVGSSGIVGHHSEYFVEAPGIVIGRKGTLGKVIYLFENFFPIDTTYFVKSKNNSVGLFYEYFLLKTMNFLEMNSDSAVPGLNRDIALSSEIRIPSGKTISEFNYQCSTLFQKIKSNTNQIQTLTKLRDTLLPKLMSGEVRVSEL